MPKELLVDPNSVRRAEKLSFVDVPIHRYTTPLADERKRYGDATLVNVLRWMLIIREFEIVRRQRL